jgi:hypothetical protein
MKLQKAILLFYRKLLVPILSFSLAIGFVGFVFTGYFSLKTVGIGIIFLTPLFLYFTYEIRNANEYNFYFNLGLSKSVLWILSLVISGLIGVTIIFI